MRYAPVATDRRSRKVSGRGNSVRLIPAIVGTVMTVSRAGTGVRTAVVGFSAVVAPSDALLDTSSRHDKGNTAHNVECTLTCGDE